MTDKYKTDEMYNRIWYSIKAQADLLTVKYNELQPHQWECMATDEIKKSMVHKVVTCRQFERIGLTPPKQYII